MIMHAMLYKITEILNRAATEDGSLIHALEEIQARLHYLPPEVLLLASIRLNVPLSQTYAVASFYHVFNLTPRGKHCLNVCMGTACHVRGSPQLLDRLETNLGLQAGQTSSDRLFTLETVNCVGACALGPIIVADGVYAGHMTPQKSDALLRRIRRITEKEGHG
jgi:NADH-quinone oxidoreductase subunit E